MPHLPINLDDLLRQRTIESERIEYKAGWNPNPIVRTLCAFANDFSNLGGGYIVIGQDTDDDGQPIFPPVGLDGGTLDRIQQELLTFCGQIRPPFFPQVSHEVVDGRHLLVLHAPGGPNRPYEAPKEVTAKKNKQYRYFIRRFTSTVEAKGEDKLELFQLTARVPFDDRAHAMAALGDISRDLVVRFLQTIGSRLADEADALDDETLYRRMNLVEGPREAPRPKNVALMFFHPEPHRFFPYTQVEVVFLPDGRGGDRIEEKVFRGPVAQIATDVLAWIERSYLKQITTKVPDTPRASRVWNWPLPAIEEAIVNALYHRSYEEHESVEVQLTPDELTVLSVPGPDPSIDLDALRLGRAVSRRYRNRRVGELLKELELTEGRSTGVAKILRSMSDNGSPPPSFETDDARRTFLVRLPVHAAAMTDPVPPQATPQATPQVPPKVMALLRACEGEMDRETLQARLGLSDRKHFRTEYLNPALARGVIAMTVPDRPRSPNQRYRLTELGLTVRNSPETG